MNNNWFIKCCFCGATSKEFPIATISWTTPIFRCAPDIPLRKGKEVDICESCIEILSKRTKQ